MRAIDRRHRCSQDSLHGHSVLQAVQHSWKAYEEYAWGYDELMPLNRSGVNSFGGLGATLIDSLDTLHMMGLTAEFKKYGPPTPEFGT